MIEFLILSNLIVFIQLKNDRLIAKAIKILLHLEIPKSSIMVCKFLSWFIFIDIGPQVQI